MSSIALFIIASSAVGATRQSPLPAGEHRDLQVGRKGDGSWPLGSADLPVHQSVSAGVFDCGQMMSATSNAKSELCGGLWGERAAEKLLDLWFGGARVDRIPDLVVWYKADGTASSFLMQNRHARGILQHQTTLWTLVFSELDFLPTGAPSPATVDLYLGGASGLATPGTPVPLNATSVTGGMLLADVNGDNHSDLLAPEGSHVGGGCDPASHPEQSCDLCVELQGYKASGKDWNPLGTILGAGTPEDVLATAPANQKSQCADFDEIPRAPTGSEAAPPPFYYKSFMFDLDPGMVGRLLVSPNVKARAAAKDPAHKHQHGFANSRDHGVDVGVALMTPLGNAFLKEADQQTDPERPPRPPRRVEGIHHRGLLPVPPPVHRRVSRSGRPS